MKFALDLAVSVPPSISAIRCTANMDDISQHIEGKAVGTIRFIFYDAQTSKQNGWCNKAEGKYNKYVPWSVWFYTTCTQSSSPVVDPAPVNFSVILWKASSTFQRLA